MKVLLTAGLFLATVLMCNGDGIIYDIKLSEVVHGEEVHTEQKAIFIEETYVTPEPPVIYKNETDEDPDSVTDSEDTLARREEHHFEKIERALGFKKDDPRIPEEHRSFQVAFGRASQGNQEWGEWTCCRRVVNVQSRSRVTSTRIDLEYKKCNRDYCTANDKCEDVPFLCQRFLRQLGASVCNPSNGMSTFMSHHCPQTCKYCPGSTGPSRPTTRPVTTQPWWARKTTAAATTLPWWARKTTTAAPTRPWWARTTAATTRRPRPTAPVWTPRPVNKDLVKVTILSHNRNPPYSSYKFVDGPVRSDATWRLNRNTASEISHLYLYKRRIGIYTMKLSFCSAKDRMSGFRKYLVKKGTCAKAWKEDFVLYAAPRRSKDTRIYYVGNRGRPRWTSKIAPTMPKTGYTNNLFYFYGPRISGSGPAPTHRPTARPWPTRRPTPRPITTRPTRRPFPPTTTKRPTAPGPQPRSAFNKECLDMHNLYRAVHNVPPLIWSPELARTSQSWADQLKRIAPERPDQLKLPHLRTRNWPHSDSGRGHRNRGDGENIAWDLSQDGSPAKESVMRWYAELFYYDRRNPTVAPAPNKPVGHLTQLLWKDTTHLGCGVGKTTVPRNGYTLISTWTVSHYSPGGNIRYPTISATNELYNRQVPDLRRGSCMTKSGTCNNGNQCMAFGGPTGDRATCSCARSRPTCRGRHGCLAWCENHGRVWPWKSECQGKTECKCTASGAECK